MPLQTWYKQSFRSAKNLCMSLNRTKTFAGVLLLIFLAQCVWLVHAQLRSEFGCYPAGNLARQGRVMEGLAQWRGQRIAGTPATQGADNLRLLVPGLGAVDYDAYRSPVGYLVASAPVAFWPPEAAAAHEKLWLWLTRVPFLVVGVLLGASLWYVTRRLYGNAGGLIALTLYCFSPGMIQSSSEVCRDSEVGAAWGTFGAVFTAIALAHTLYAPREVVLWNWRRIALLAISLTLAVGSQFSLVILVPVALAFLLYLAPQRRAAALVIWAAACLAAGLALVAAYFFHFQILWQSFRAARWLDLVPGALTLPANYHRAARSVLEASPLLAIFFPIAIIAYLFWKRARYFGNTAPLLVAILCLVLALAAPDFPGRGFLLVAVPFLFAFVAGVFADLLETRLESGLRILLPALLSGYALWSLVALAQV